MKTITGGEREKIPVSRSWNREAFRSQFKALDEAFDGKKVVYLDSACTALKPISVAESVAQFYLRGGTCGGKRATHILAQKVEILIGESRRKIADFVGAESASEIVFTSGTTEAVNILARSFPYEGDRREVVISDLEHNAVFLPFYESAQRGEIELKICPSREARIDLNCLERLVTDKTALVAVTRASNVAGGVQPLAEVIGIAHRRGAVVFTDDAQYLPSHRENFAALNVDFAAFSGHKLGGPFGFGVLYGKEHLLNRLRPAKVGGGTVKAVSFDGNTPRVEYLDAPERLEAGIQNIGGAIGVAQAIRVLEEIPPEALRSHIESLVRRALKGLAKFSEIKTLGQLEDLTGGSIISFYPQTPRFSVSDFNLFLNHELPDHFIAIRAGEHCAHLLHQSLKIPSTVRLSFFAYNTPEEVNLFLGALERYIKEAAA